MMAPYLPVLLVVLQLALLPSFAAPSSLAVTLTPWCSNSWRVQVAPSSRSPEGAAEAARLSATLSSHGLADIPGALVDTCGPGAPVQPVPGAPASSNGNLAVALLDDGGGSTTPLLRFSRVDTGAVLLTAALSLSAPSFSSGCSAGLASGAVVRVATVTLADAEAWCAANATCTAFSTNTTRPCNGAPLDGATPVPVTFVSGKATTNGDPSWRTWAKPPPPGGSPYLAGLVNVTAGDAGERIFGLGQGEWTRDGSCPNGAQNGSVIVPLQRNGATVNLQQRKFHVTIPFVYSTAGYGFLFNMPGFGAASVGAYGVGGMSWTASAALGLDIWVTGLPAGEPASSSSSSPPAAPVYKQYADATGHAPPLRDPALRFWQSRNRYKSTAITTAVAAQYQALGLADYLGLLVVDYENQAVDGDFNPNPHCYPSVAALAANVSAATNATTMISFWPEIKANASTYALFSSAGCLTNSDLGGFAVDTTIPSCRDLIWGSFLKPNYYDQGVSAYWLDETDGDGEGGFNTSFGPAVAYSNLWVGSWITSFSQPVADLGEATPLVLTRGVWAGGQRHGIVLWSSDIDSTFEQLASMVPQGVHASMSGIPWWTTDVGGYGCGQVHPNDSPYMQELIVRWYQFGLFCPVFRTHGCRMGPAEPDVPPCVGVASSCGPNELWSYGNATQAILETYVRFRSDVLLPYMRALDANVTAAGVPTMRPLWYEFPGDPACFDVDDEYLLGPGILVAPVTSQGATERSVVFPAGATWVSVWNATDVVEGGQTLVVQAPLSVIPAYFRQ
jgi:alpha-D-xyloside xylohydrolase